MVNPLEKIISSEPKYRIKQIYQGWFEPKIRAYEEITTLSQNLRTQLSSVPFLTIKPGPLATDEQDKTEKILLELNDGFCIETVLMGRENKKNKETGPRYTICVSTQAGCPMGCAFCSTGKLGFKRNLSAYEIVDQYRFWLYHLYDTNQGKIDNIVLMGQGEPLANYEAVKQFLQIILENTDIGPRQITLSTVGVQSGMEKMITDEGFPPVRFALSLHSAINETRQLLIPTHTQNFFSWLIDWSKKYHQKFSSRAHFIGLEYIMIEDKNDDARHLKELIKLSSQLGKIRINLIPYNSTMPNWRGTNMEKIKEWRDALIQKGFVTTIRHSQGQNILAACGQLANKINK